MIPTDHARLEEVFLAEARETLALLAAGAARLRSAEPVADAVGPLLVLTHRLRGAAAQYGYAATADVAGLVEQALRSIDGLSVDERDRATGLITEGIALLGRDLEKVAVSRAAEPDPAASAKGPVASGVEGSEHARSAGSVA